MNITKPIPADLMKKISTRARNILIREKILTCERLISCSEKDLHRIGGVGIRTVNEKLRVIALFPDDPADVLFNITMLS